ncbi:ClpP/crotonase [Coprinellus micaceus]|uniref:ClpP/crotonase n=1 Tax=Coprinellus micaceus TaxID=71717 RepID=A0A4Y7TNX7_COPMI|nr:ClpP/crotonase [Coprinellus micaceus]
MSSESTITLDISDRIATLTLNRPNSLNSLTAADYAYLSDTLREIDANEDVLVTILQGTGRWFCAGTDVKAKDPKDAISALGNVRKSFKTYVADTTIDVGHALHSHRKILVAVLNGPVMGIMAAFLGHFDFIYALPSTWLACPFTRLGIVAEGGASVSFVNRMGLSMAKEVLIWGKKKTAQELLAAGFLNKIYPEQSVESFHQIVRKGVLDDLEGLDPSSLLTVKSLINAGLDEKNSMDGACLREAYAQAGRFASGTPAQQFQRIATKEIKHKL